MRIFVIVSVLILSLSCTAKKDCRTDREACAETADCCDGLACFEGRCGAPRACPDEAPVDCGATVPGLCCPSDLPYCCAKDSTCYASESRCNGPACLGRSCSLPSGCCAGAACARFGKTCHLAKDLPIGEGCKEPAQCASQLCIGYCTKPCFRSSDCGPQNNCLNTADGFRCVPDCATAAQCTVFGTNMDCQSSKDPSGVTFTGCFGQ